MFNEVVRGEESSVQDGWVSECICCWDNSALVRTRHEQWPGVRLHRQECVCVCVCNCTCIKIRDKNKVNTIKISNNEKFVVWLCVSIFQVFLYFVNRKQNTLVANHNAAKLQNPPTGHTQPHIDSAVKHTKLYNRVLACWGNLLSKKHSWGVQPPLLLSFSLLFSSRHT